MYALDYDDDYATMFKCEHERERETYVKKYMRNSNRNNW